MKFLSRLAQFLMDKIPNDSFCERVLLTFIFIALIFPIILMDLKNRWNNAHCAIDDLFIVKNAGNN